MKAARYARVEEEVRNRRVSTLIEIGTWSGDRAIALASVTSWPFFYHGFDLFEDMTPSVSQREFNVKRTFSIAEVYAKLGEWRQRSGRRDVEFGLHKGNTIKTLPDFHDSFGNGVADMAWIDGGHSLPTIANDLYFCNLLVRKGGVILLDDFYVGVSGSVTDVVGCNAAVAELERKGAEVTILPETDELKDSSGQVIGGVRIARVIV